jgi:hypothetical protein
MEGKNAGAFAARFSRGVFLAIVTVRGDYALVPHMLLYPDLIQILFFVLWCLKVDRRLAERPGAAATVEPKLMWPLRPTRWQ